MSGSLHPHAHTASCCLQLAIELLGFSIAVTQSPFTPFSGVGTYKRDLLNAGVIVHTYNPHIGSFLPSLGSSTNQSLLGDRGGRHCYEIRWAMPTGDSCYRRTNGCLCNAPRQKKRWRWTPIWRRLTSP